MRECPICGRGLCRSLGEVRHHKPTRVAGVEIDLRGMDFRLIECETCGFEFKDPPIPEDRLLACYARASADNWELNPDPYRRYFDVFKEEMHRRRDVRRIMDIGCFNGALLQWLAEGREAFGVEPSQAAAEVARQRGVKLLGSRLEEVPPETEPMDVIFAIDVLEHVADPLPFFCRVRDLLGDGGAFIAFTGDTAAPNWRRLGSLYWYCSFPEHVSFFCRRTLEHLGREVGLRIVQYRRLSHERGTPGQKASEFAKNWFFIIGTRLKWLGVAPLKSKFNRCGPMWLTGNDHMLVVMERVAACGS